MGSVLDWIMGKRGIKKWKGKPLYRKGNQIYWKGCRVDDDEFSRLMYNNSEEVAQYNRYVRNANRRKNKRKRMKR